MTDPPTAHETVTGPIGGNGFVAALAHEHLFAALRDELVRANVLRRLRPNAARAGAR